MTDDFRDAFGFAEAWRKDPSWSRRMFAGVPSDLVPLFCPVCEQRFGVPRACDLRFPPALALMIYTCDACSERDAAEEVDQIWLDAEGYPVEPLPGLQ